MLITANPLPPSSPGTTRRRGTDVLPQAGHCNDARLPETSGREGARKTRG